MEVKVHHYNTHSAIHFNHPAFPRTRTIQTDTEASAERQADLIRSLDQRYNGIVVAQRQHEDVMSAKVAADGKAPMAAYLYVFNRLSKEEISDILSVSIETVDQYLTDVITGRR